MSGQGGGGEKTEKATPKRVKKARRDGQIGNTPEVGMWLGMLAASFLLPHVASGLLDLGRNGLVQAGAVIRDPDTSHAMTAAGTAAGAAVKTIVPLGVWALVWVAASALGIFSSVELRANLAATPMFVCLAAYALGAMGRTSRSGLAVAAAGLVAIAHDGVRVWLFWLGR